LGFFHLQATTFDISPESIVVFKHRIHIEFISTQVDVRQSPAKHSRELKQGVDNDIYSNEGIGSVGSLVKEEEEEENMKGEIVHSNNNVT
jgi:hypothetical protein